MWFWSSSKLPSWILNIGRKFSKYKFEFPVTVQWVNCAALFSHLTLCQSLQAFFSANAAAQASRKSSPRVNNEAVQKAVSACNNVVFSFLFF